MVHAISPRFLLGLCQAAFGRCPRAWLVSVPGSDFSFGEGLSAVADLGMRQALGTIERLIARAGSPEPGPAPECPRSALLSSAVPRTPTMSVRIIQVDSFTNRPFAGNPAAVCLLDAPADRALDAACRGRDESVGDGVRPSDRTRPLFRLRWFTPRVEVDLCGHATLAAAHVLWEEGLLARKPPRSSRPAAAASRPPAGDWIELDFPAEPIDPRSRRRARSNRRGPERAVDVGGPEPVRSSGRAGRRGDRSRAPAGFRRVGDFPVRGVIVTSRSSSPEFDFVSRFFAPRVGVDEDPVCGSAHCCLGPFWASKLGRNELTGHQVSPRGGVVKVRVERPAWP